MADSAGGRAWILIVETDDLRRWNAMSETLRDSVLFTRPYFRLERIVTTLEEGYLAYEGAQG